MTASTGSGTADGVQKRHEVAKSGGICTAETPETAVMEGTRATCGIRASASLVISARVMGGVPGSARMGTHETQLTTWHASAETLVICGRALTGRATTLAVSGGGIAVRRITFRRLRLRH